MQYEYLDADFRINFSDYDEYQSNVSLHNL